MASSSKDASNSQQQYSPLKAPSKKARLTEAEKKANHVTSEQKRRAKIRDAYLRISQIVPGAEGKERSEEALLRLFLSHARQMTEERRHLVDQIEAEGGLVEDALRKT